MSGDGVILGPAQAEPGLLPGMATISRYAVDTMQMAADMAAMFEHGRAYAPGVPILIRAYDDATPVVYFDEPGSGIEIAQIVDEVMEIIDSQRLEHAAHGRGLDYDGLREKHGLNRREDASKRMQDQIQQRIAQHKANPVTDPFRQPRIDRLGQFKGISLPAVEEAS